MLEDSMAFTPGVAAARTGVAARWLMAGAAVVLATAINFGVQHATGGPGTFLTYFPALVFVGVYSGAVPALLSLGASALLGWYFWFPPLNHFGPPRAEDSIALLLFVIAGGVVISISVRARELIDHLRASREALRQAQAAVHESEQQMRLALEGAQLGMWTTDLESGVTHASDIDAALFGFEARARIL